MAYPHNVYIYIRGYSLYLGNHMTENPLNSALYDEFLLNINRSFYVTPWNEHNIPCPQFSTESSLCEKTCHANIEQAKTNAAVWYVKIFSCIMIQRKRVSNSSKYLVDFLAIAR